MYIYRSIVLLYTHYRKLTLVSLYYFSLYICYKVIMYNFTTVHVLLHITVWVTVTGELLKTAYKLR